MMTAYSQIGQDLSNQVSHLDAFVPSGVEENKLGFDIQIPFLKGLVFQFKRPKPDNPRRFNLRYSDQSPPRQLDRMKNWEAKYGPSAAFYALPLIIDHNNLRKTLNRTAFIPASEIDGDASVIRISEGYVEQGEGVQDEPVEIYCSNPRNTSDSRTEFVDSSKVLGWKDLKDGIKNCNAGFVMRSHGESYIGRYHNDHIWNPEDIDEWDEEEFESLFIGRQSPTLTRIGSEEVFDW